MLLAILAFSIVPSMSIDVIAARMGNSSGGGGTCGGGMGCGGSGSGVIDPPIGPSFKDPTALQDKNPADNVFEGDLEAKVSQVNVNGVMANLYTYNGYYPGPTIKIKQGDLLKINFKNSLPVGGVNILGFPKGVNNIHTHGFHVSPEEPADAAHLAIPSGGTYNYMYDTSKQPAGSLSFYHCHIHGLTAEQYWAGLSGCLITEDSTDALAGYETHTMMIKDITLSGNQPQAYSSTMDFMQGKEGNIIMINGQVNPVLTMRPGQVQRWRIVNSCNARFMKLNLAQHNLQLIGTDGGLLDKPYQHSEILVAPGERIDVLIKASATAGNYKLLSLPYNRKGNMLSETITLLTVKVETGIRLADTLPTQINKDATKLNIDTSMLPVRKLTLSMKMGRGYINGMDFDVKPYTIMSRVGTYEVWEISVQGGMDHPFHFHVNHAQVLSIIGGDQNYASLYTTIPAWKDTIIVPKWGTIRILVSIQDYTGMTMFHCHIVEHEDIGMMGMWHIMEPMPMPM